MAAINHPIQPIVDMDHLSSRSEVRQLGVVKPLEYEKPRSLKILNHGDHREH